MTHLCFSLMKVLRCKHANSLRYCLVWSCELPLRRAVKRLQVWHFPGENSYSIRTETRNIFTCDSLVHPYWNIGKEQFPHLNEFGVRITQIRREIDFHIVLVNLPYSFLLNPIKMNLIKTQHNHRVQIWTTRRAQLKKSSPHCQSLESYLHLCQSVHSSIVGTKTPALNLAWYQHEFLRHPTQGHVSLQSPSFEEQLTLASQWSLVQ